MTLSITSGFLGRAMWLHLGVLPKPCSVYQEDFQARTRQVRIDVRHNAVAGIGGLPLPFWAEHSGFSLEVREEDGRGREVGGEDQPVAVSSRSFASRSAAEILLHGGSLGNDIVGRVIEAGHEDGCRKRGQGSGDQLAADVAG